MNPTRNNAVQIILNAQNFVTAKPSGGGGSETDFYLGQDEAFSLHKNRILGELAKIQSTLSASRWGGTDYLRVKLKPDAWAKSHRPTGKLFTPDVCQSVGADAIGQPIFEVSPVTLSTIIDRARSAEEKTRINRDPSTGEETLNTSKARSEVGAIDKIELFNPSDKQKFSAKHAVEWFQQSGSAPFYVVDLFSLPLSENEMNDYPTGRRELIRSFVAGLNSLGIGVATARSRLAGGRQHYYLLIKVVRVSDYSSPNIFRMTDEIWGALQVDLDPGNHNELLRFLSTHPLVRKIHLPPIVRQHLQNGTNKLDKKFALPARKAGELYPKIGVVDGGISDVLGSWIIGRDGLLDRSHCDLSHGTFIAGLLVAGRTCGNSEDVARELDGCDIYDVDLFPDPRQNGLFDEYHPHGFDDFLDALDGAIASAKAKHNVRIFNLSINVLLEVDSDKYSIFAEMLDGIAQKHDSIIVVSGGNLDRSKERSPWPNKVEDILTYLASLVGRSSTDKLLQPSESVYAITVTAVNPPGMTNHPAGAPTSYTRRGPGMDVGVKPEFAHYSGAGPELLNHHGLYSIDEVGNIATSMGTSFAAPLVAKTLAKLESRITGYVPREMLIALMVHHAKVPKVLTGRNLHDFARHFVGFGVPAASGEMLSTGDYAITMVFSGTIQQGQWLEFPFNWPQSLTDGGSCRVAADMTIAYRPFLDPRYAAEFLRVNLDASLLQHDGAGNWKGELRQIFIKKTDNDHVSEKELITHGLKWWPIKHYTRLSVKGIGKSSDWKLRVQSLLRDGEEYPDGGVPFTVVLSLRDPDGKKPIFQEMKQWLTAHSVDCGEITAGIQLRARS